jgi:hypothetical protein
VLSDLRNIATSLARANGGICMCHPNEQNRNVHPGNRPLRPGSVRSLLQHSWRHDLDALHHDLLQLYWRVLGTYVWTRAPPKRLCCVCVSGVWLGDECCLWYTRRALLARVHACGLFESHQRNKVDFVAMKLEPTRLRGAMSAWRCVRWRTS